MKYAKERKRKGNAEAPAHVSNQHNELGFSYFSRPPSFRILAVGSVVMMA